MTRFCFSHSGLFGRRVLVGSPCAASCRDHATRGPAESPADQRGGQSHLPEPEKQADSHRPVAEAKGWPPDAKPMPADESAVNAFASGLAHPRWLYVLPNGDVLVAETNAPEAARRTTEASKPRS